MNFICGCQMPTLDRLEGDKELSSLDTCTYDAEGFLTCSVHHMRRQGWRSLPMEDTKNGRRPIWAYASWTELQVERFVLFGEHPEIRGLAGVSKPSVPDLRDSRDPEEIGIHMLAMGSRPSNNPQWLTDSHDDEDRDRHNGGQGRGLMAYHQHLARQNLNGKVTIK